MIKSLSMSVCALLFAAPFLSACTATDEPATQQTAAPVPAAMTAPVAQPQARVGGVPVSMLVPSPRTIASGSTLGETELTQILLGNTIKQVDDQYWAYFGSGGVLKGLIVNLEETGSYSLSGGQVCKSWPTWATGMKLCYRVLNLGNSKYRFSGIGVDSFDVVISRGNPQQL